ncbi:hypothetical protein H261_19486 [Paramagnetospirillum caucaseum]|uniref:Zorya protein ZorC EH domain-containing protein n=1 Tax=Paramagnetospirillum caucaseum TaxID=1244869 RepID=M3A6V7_9PROT|nr:EH signature domain-containing protein [Paramagnetospirillum caucaseum]EME68214.1 hypothetical protein H261_19486 [Paramagnetospirillum caucaseum]
MNFEDALAKLAAWSPKKVAFPPTPVMVHEANAVAKRLREVSASVNLIDLDDLRRRLSQARSAGDWTSISTRDWRYVADCLGAGQSPLVDDAGFLDEYLARLKDQLSRRAISRLIRYYVTHFDPAHQGLRKIAAFLQVAVGQWQWQWSDKEAVDMFDVSNAPSQLAKYVRRSKEMPAADAMEAAGLGGTLYGCKLAGHAYIAAANGLKTFISNNPSSLPAIRRFASWGVVDSRFAFDGTSGAAARMAEAMLLPWVDRQPPDDVRSFIESHLLALLHDLRIERSRWLDVAEDAKRVMRRWLTRASLEQFLDVVDRTAQTHMWAARRKFWNAYYENKFMLEAWVAFAKDGADLAKRLAAEKENPAIGNFGLLESGARDKTQAVLIMQIGELLVADWSHNGKCHVWLSGNPSAPKLYRSYSREDLVTGSDFEKMHLGAWQSDVHEYIRRNTGIRMMSRDYM